MGRAAGLAPRPRVLPRPVEQFIATETSGGVVLIVSALLAFAWANSPYADSYHALQHLPVGINAGVARFEMSLAHWINDGLMVLFFFVVGLEIKRELLVGELAGWRRAALPTAGALGGMIVPALIYVAMTSGTPAVVGWGVPMATDIAFAVGVLGVLGRRIPSAARLFLLTLAIVDDIGAVLVIALFYTADLDMMALAIAAALLVLAAAYGRAGGPNPLIYILIGVPLWIATLVSGVHATVAGVLLAFTVPMVRGVGPEELKEELTRAAGATDFESVEIHLNHLEDVVDRAQSPLHEFAHTLQPWVAFVIMPVFAFFNAGVTLSAPEGQPLIGLSTMAVFAGLLIGKPIGITAAVGLAVLTRTTTLPRGVGWAGMLGTGMIAGIGFTMAIFIANLAFGEGSDLDQAKLGILIASVVAAVIGFVTLWRVLPTEKSP